MNLRNKYSINVSNLQNLLIARSSGLASEKLENEGAVSVIIGCMNLKLVTTLGQMMKSCVFRPL